MRKLLPVFFYLLSVSLFAQNQFGFRVMPTINIPAGKDHFTTGFGASASLDWAFASINPGIDFGVSVMGGLVNFPVEKTDAFSLLETGLGPFAQWRINDHFSLGADLNTGIYQYAWENSNNTKFRIGGALSARYHLTPYFSVYASAGYTHHSFSDTQPINAVKAGVGIHLNLSELLRPQARLQGERIEQNRVFPVIFAWYEKNSIAAVRITNGEPNAVTNVQLSFLLERYMNQPSVFTTIDRLGPGESIEVPVNALLNESMLDLTETIFASAQVIAEYRSLGVKKTNSFPMQMPIYHRNAMTWDDDRRAAAFASPRDPAAVYFARYVSSAAGQRGQETIPENVRQAAALFESLKLYGLNYVLDSTSSYVEKTDNAAVVDNMTYPYETLFYRSGACDGISILFTAMLEALNIEGAFITIPGHIYIAFAVGDDEWRRGNADIIEISGKRWLPVEITVLDRGFSEACRIGAREWRNAGTEARLYPMRESWQLYPPVSVSAAGDNLPPMPERAEIAKALEAELRKLR